MASGFLRKTAGKHVRSSFLTLRGFVIVLSGNYGPDVETEGVALSARAFGEFIPGFGKYFLTMAVTLFAFSTSISWSYYGETATEYLLCRRTSRVFKALFVGAVFAGAILDLGSVIAFSDLTLGLMVIPNLFAVLLLLPLVRDLADEYFRKL